METKIKPIETTYRGYRFRSRLEARWAVFLDSFNEEWEYEVEGYQLPSGRYLPDFWLPRLYCWLEIKGEKPTAEEDQLCLELAQETDKPVAIAWGLPRTPKCEQVYHHGLKSWKDEYVADGLEVYCVDQLASMRTWNRSFWAMDEDNKLCICSNQDHFELAFFTSLTWEPFYAMKLIQEIKEPISEAHVNIAKSARFEFER